MSIYVHLCCSMGDMLIIQKILVGWKFDKKIFWIIKISGMKIWKISIYVHLCCSMDEILIIQTNQKKHLPELKKYSMYTSGIFYVHVFFQFLKMP